MTVMNRLEVSLTLVTPVRILLDSGWWRTNLGQGTLERERERERERVSRDS